MTNKNVPPTGRTASSIAIAIFAFVPILDPVPVHLVRRVCGSDF